MANGLVGNSTARLNGEKAVFGLTKDVGVRNPAVVKPIVLKLRVNGEVPKFERINGVVPKPERIIIGLPMPPFIIIEPPPPCIRWAWTDPADTVSAATVIRDNNANLMINLPR
jgi:hypothetical protein